MMLIVWYVLFMLLGDLVAYFLGMAIEYKFGAQASLVAFLALYFVALWVAWVGAVFMTEPKKKLKHA